MFPHDLLNKLTEGERTVIIISAANMIIERLENVNKHQEIQLDQADDKIAELRKQLEPELGD